MTDPSGPSKYKNWQGSVHLRYEKRKKKEKPPHCISYGNHHLRPTFSDKLRGACPALSTAALACSGLPGASPCRREAPGVSQKSSPLLPPPPGTPLPQEYGGGLPPPKERLESCKYVMFGKNNFAVSNSPLLAFLKPKLLE